MVNLDLLTTRLKTLATALSVMNKNGVSEDILICWLRVKTGLSKTHIKTFLKSQDEFFEKLINEEALNNL